MLKAENMSSMVSVIDTIAASSNIPAKVVGEEFIEYWKVQMEKDPHIRNILEVMTPEEMKEAYGPDMKPKTGDEDVQVENKEEIEQNPEIVENPEVQQNPEEPEERAEVKSEIKTKKTTPTKDSKEEEEIRNNFA